MVSHSEYSINSDGTDAGDSAACNGSGFSTGGDDSGYSAGGDDSRSRAASSNSGASMGQGIS
jgi:hypothetical protein